MPLQCKQCGFKGSRAEFRFLQFVDSAGPNTYRRCPECHAAVYCEELEIVDSGSAPWGTGYLRGQVFRRPRKSD